MATYGVTAAGFLAKPLATIEAEIDEDLRGILGDSAGTEDDGTIPLESMAGQLKSLLVDAFAAQWDLQEAVHASLDPNQATGASQDAVASITGTIRDDKEFSTVTVTCVGDPNTQLIAGRVVTVEDTGSRFATLEAATIALLTSWSALTVYSIGDRRTNSNRAYVCITAGTSAASGGPSGTTSDITDGTVHWMHLGAGTGAVDVDCQAEEAGPVGGLAGDVNQIATPVSGWNAVINLLDTNVGRLRESDPAFRIRRDQEAASAGNTTRDAIRANILRVNQGSSDANHEQPTACEVFINDTDHLGSDNLPPHSIECLVQGGTDADVAQAIWDSVGAGTATYGTRSDSVIDSEGNTQTVSWSRPVEVPIYVTATAFYDANQWPADSDALVAQTVLSALLTYAEDYPIGRDVRVTPLAAAMLRGPAETNDDGEAVVPADPASSATPGLLEINPIYIGTTASPVSSTSVTITGRQIAVFDSSRCVLTASAETP